MVAEKTHWKLQKLLAAVWPPLLACDNAAAFYEMKPRNISNICWTAVELRNIHSG